MSYTPLFLSAPPLYEATTQFKYIYGIGRGGSGGNAWKSNGRKLSALPAFSIPGFLYPKAADEQKKNSPGCHHHQRTDRMDRMDRC